MHIWLGCHPLPARTQQQRHPERVLRRLDIEPALTWTARFAHSASRPLSAAAAALVSELEGGTP